MTHQFQSNTTHEAVQLLAEHGFEAMAQAIQVLMNEAMRIERAHYLQADPYQRSAGRRSHANGFKPKTFSSRLGKLQLQIPQTRDSQFYPSTLERGERSERALKLALAEMYVQGVSTRKVAAITKELCGLDVSSAQVSRAAKLLDEELDAWRSRKLDQVQYLVLDARYEKVRVDGTVRDCAVLVAIGILPDGHRSVLGVSCSLSEAEVHWRSFLENLLTRGMKGVQCIVSDQHSGLKAARKAVLPSVPWQRCQFHLMQNAMHYIPKLSMRKEAAEDLRAVFLSKDQHTAQEELRRLVAKYQTTAPSFADWFEKNVPEGLKIFQLPAEHRKRMRTTNLLERLNKEMKRRTQVATLFLNEASLLRLITAVLTEYSDDWETGRKYLTITP